MNILYVAMKHDYGKPEQGFSYEHWNFFDSLRRMGHRILYFDFMSLLNKYGRDGMNRRLIEVARAEQSDVMFTVLFRDEIAPRTLRRVADDAGIPTLNWFCDDQWRFEDFSRRWAPHFTWAITTSAATMERYHRAGVRNVINSQWACNHFLYRKLDLPKSHDVTFIGQPHGNRRALIHALRNAGVTVKVWGQGWPSGRLSQEEMIAIFNESRINLNLANASSAPPRRTGKLKAATMAAASTIVSRLPQGYRIKRVGNALIGRRPPSEPADYSESDVETEGTAPRLPSQVKGRNFEVPGCGGFLLTDPAEELEHFYLPGREVVVFRNLRELMEQIRYYLLDDAAREAIAQAGWERTLREHTYVHRFSEIFRTVGLSPSPSRDLRNEAMPGEAQEIE